MSLRRSVYVRIDLEANTKRDLDLVEKSLLNLVTNMNTLSHYEWEVEKVVREDGGVEEI